MPKKSNLFISHSKSDEEAAGFKKLITQLGAMAGKAAHSEAKALHLPKIYATNESIIVQQVDGTQRIVTTAKAEHHGHYFQKFVLKHE